MIRAVAVVACLALSAGGASASDPEQPPAPPPPPAASAPEPAQPVKQVALDPSKPQPVCRRVAPTGSRIKEEVCKLPQADSAARDAAHEQIRRDIDEMRARQIMRDQVQPRRR